MSILSHQFVFDALEAEKAGDRFPIDFDDVWQALGYSRRDNAVRKLVNYMVEDVDFVKICFLNLEESVNHADLSAQQKAALSRGFKYKLTIHGFKSFAMTAHTAEGRKVRAYFIDLERAYVATLELQYKAAAASAPIIPAVKYPYHLSQLHQISGIKSKSSIKTAIRRDLEVGVDYIEIGGDLILTEDAFNWLVVSFRSERGTDTSKLPQNIVLSQRGFRLRVRRKNARLSSNTPQ